MNGGGRSNLQPPFVRDYPPARDNLPPPLTGAPAISGTAQVGETLTADTSGIADADGLTNVSYGYQWTANDGSSDTDIQNATGKSYTLAAADEGKTIRVKVSFTDDANNEETLTSAATAPVAARPDPGIAPDTPDQPTGTAVFAGGVDLEWNDVPGAGSYDVQLFRNGQWMDLPGDGVEIAFYGAGAVISELDTGSGYWFQVRAGNAHGSSDWSDYLFMTSTNQYELGKRARPANAAATGAPVITGAAQAGETLTADTAGIADANGLDRVQFRFQWVSNDGSADTDIADAADSSYTPAASDEGRTLKVRVSFTDRGGYAESLTSDATGAVGPAVQQQIANSPATGAPTITGTARVGETLTADTSGIADADGLTNVTYGYQWIRNDGSSDTDIAGAADSSYTPAASDEGRTLKVRVSFTDRGGYAESLTSDATGAVAPAVQQQIANSPATGAPAISGTAQVGETLTADTSGIADADGLSGASFSYQWTANDGSSDSDITGATDSTHTLADADEGKTIKVKVSFTDDANNDETLTSAATATVAARPDPGIAPDTPEKPTGTAVFAGGVDLEWNDVPGAASYDAQLFRNGQWTDLPGDGVEIAFYGAGAIISGLDTGSGYWFQVRAGNAHGSSDWSDYLFMTSTNQYELGKRARPDNAAATGAPVITGTAQVGETLTADTAGMEDGNGLDRVQFRFQWVSNDGSADTDVAGAADSGYTLAASDEGRTLKVRVSFTDRGGYAESLTSAATATVQAAPNSPATGAPAITGTAQVGETLTADTSAIADADGLSGVTFSYQWVTNDGSSDTDIPNATDSTYTLVDADEGKTMKVTVSFTDDADNEETLTSAATATVDTAPNSPATGAPAISGTAQVGETLTVDTSGIADADGLTNVSYSYQWIRNDGSSDTDITDAADSSYTLAAADGGKTIRVKVSFTDDGDNEESLTSDATATVDAAPNSPATGAPTITGTAQVGETLTADTAGIADADGLTNVSYSYQWAANDGSSDTDIQDATGSSYTLVDADEGKTVRVKVSFTDDAGNDETLTSAATATVGFAVQEQIDNSPATGTLAITGTAQVGETLTADTSGIADADGLTNAAYSYQWVANDGTSDTDITGATASTYTLVDADEGKTIKVTVSFTDDADNEETLTSAATATVDAAPNSPATGAPTISGTARVGETLTADTSGIADADGLTNVSFSYQWVRNDGTSDMDIQSATGSNYTPVDADEGNTIKVTVSFTDDADNEETLTSAATVTVDARPNSPATGTPAITGTAQVGETLTVDTSGIADADGLSNAAFNYQWLADDAEIQGATASTYTLADSDEGKAIRVTASFTDDAGNPESLTSAATNDVASAGPTEPPPAPSNLTAVENADGSVTLTWDAPDDGSVTGYRILRRNADAGEHSLSVHVPDTGSAATSYTDTDVAAGTKYVYRVKAINEAGVGPKSRRVMITTSG